MVTHVVPTLFGAIAFSLGIWMIAIPGAYIRGYLRTATSKWANFFRIEDSNGWRLLFRILGCLVLVFAGFYLYAVAHQR